MRRKEREIKDTETIVSIIEHMRTIRVAIASDDAPYIVPLSFGFERNGDDFIFYLHSAKEGRKIELIGKNPAVGFEMDECLKLKGEEEACTWTAEYVSVIGTGELKLVENSEEKKHGLEVLMKSMTGKSFDIPYSALDHVAVLRLDVKSISAKGNGFIGF